MDWNSRTIAVAPSRTDSPLGALVESLFEQQIETWPQLQEGIAALDAVEVHRLEINGIAVSMQHNPRRIISTSARVDERSIRERPCFLCSQNMPVEEKGLALGDDLMVFCNPFPVLARHMVVLAREHIPQSIGGHLEQFLDLAASLGSSYAAIYNGAKCGASAPDHLHFQAGRVEELPIFDEIARQRSREKSEEILVSASYGAGFIWFGNNDPRHALLTIESVLETLKSDMQEDEPMVNLLARHDGAEWLVAVIPRRKHRPSAYFEEGEARILVSPAAIDLAGLVVVPRKKDFERLDAVRVRGMFNEVTLATGDLHAIVARVSARIVAETHS